MAKFADLHIHTNFSDSTSSPQDVVREAKSNGLTGIAITDHDTIDAIGPALEAARSLNIEIIPGIELSTEMLEKDIHILGYCFDCTNEYFLDKLKQFRDTRVERVKKMLAKLKEQGIDNITVEEVARLTQSDALGRAHLAVLLEEKGWVGNKHEAFRKYLGEDCPAYVAKHKQTPYEAIDLIRRAGGVAVMAHPMVTNKDELIPSFVEAGLGGLEVYYPNCTENVTRYYEGIARKHDLVMTGGSDAHGDVKDYTFVGKIRVPYERVEELKSRCR